MKNLLPPHTPHPLPHSPLPLRWIDVLYYAKYGNPEPGRRLEQPEEVWKEQLTPVQYQVLREKETEPAFRNAYCRSWEPGIYSCRGCGSALFSAESKSRSLAGWPGFSQPLSKSAIRYAFDNSHNMQRIEALCNVCDGHLGHVFPHGPEPAGLRYCINSASLERRESCEGVRE